MPLSGRPIRHLLFPTAVLLAAEALEEQWRQAQLAGDVAVMDKLLSDDYIGISMTGQVNTKMQQLDRMRLHKVALTKLDLGDRQVKLIGSIAIVTSRAEVEGTNDGLPIKGTFRYTRVYQRLPSGVWRITSFEATRVPGSGGGPRNHSHDPESKAATVPPPGPAYIFTFGNPSNHPGLNKETLPLGKALEFLCLVKSAGLSGLKPFVLL